MTDMSVRRTRSVFRIFGVSGAALGVALALAAPGIAHAEPGYTTIFDGTATGSDASFDKWAQAGGGDIALQPDGSMRTSSGFGMRWYTAKPYGDVSLKVDYRDARTVAGHSNGGVLVRFPDPRTPASQTPAS